MAAHLGYEDIV